MSGFILVKGMNRELTDDGRKRIAEWWEANPDKSLTEVVTHWEAELGMPVTDHAVVRSVVQGMVAHVPTSEPE